MEIRRIETDMIRPPAAGDHAQDVAADRHQEPPRRRLESRKHHEDEEETPEGEAHDAHHGQMYNPEGHVEELEVPDTSGHIFDTRA